MKPEDAIEWLNKIMPEWDYEANLYCAETCMGLGEYVCTEPEGYVFKTAIEALEKQIPNKPIIAKNLMTKHVSAICSICNMDITFYGSNEKYCHNCGQAIKWE